MNHLFKFRIGFGKDCFTIFCLMFCCFVFEKNFSQNYRTANAYIEDFGKNELYVKESIIGYSQTIIDNNSIERTQDKLNKIYFKLKNINTILSKNDKGFNGDTELRNAFMELNSKTITLLQNKTLILNDYKEQSLLNIEEIEKNFSTKEMEIKNYYNSLLDYEEIKKEFGKKYSIDVKSNSKKNVLEFNALQNLTFYKLNVIDEKLISLMNSKDEEKTISCMNFLIKTGEMELLKMEEYQHDYKNSSLTFANKKLIEMLINQKEELLPLFLCFTKEFKNINKIKTQFKENDKSITIEVYNENVKKYNIAKNNFFNKLNSIQNQKMYLINNWCETNSNFLKKNLKFENIHEKFIDQSKEINVASSSTKVKKY